MNKSSTHTFHNCHVGHKLIFSCVQYQPGPCECHWQGEQLKFLVYFEIGRCDLILSSSPTILRIFRCPYKAEILTVITALLLDWFNGTKQLSLASLHSCLLKFSPIARLQIMAVPYLKFFKHSPSSSELFITFISWHNSH